MLRVDLSYLSDSLRDRREILATSARDVVDQLLSDEPAARLAGVDAVSPALEGRDPEALPFVLHLATHPHFPARGALLLRLTQVVAAIDRPPRGLAGGGGTESERALYDRIAIAAPRFVRTAGTSRDPAVGVLAGCLAARFPNADSASAPILIALMSGAKERESRARVIYGLARVQLASGATLHPRIAAALDDSNPPGHFGALIAVADHHAASGQPLAGPIATRLQSALERACTAPHIDPRTFGRTFDETDIEECLVRLRDGSGSR